jgi:hypothetical protein
MDDEAGTVTLSKDDFKAVMGKLGGHKQTAKRSQTNLIFLAFGYLAVSVGFIAVIVGLMNWRLEATKETKMSGTDMVGKSGQVARVGVVESFAEVYDLPKFDAHTLTQVKHITLTLNNGQEEAFQIQRISKKTGALAATFYDGSGNKVTIDAATLSCTATIGGKIHMTKHVAASQARRRLLRNNELKLYTREEIRQRRHAQRNLGAAGSGDVGFARLALRAVDGVAATETAGGHTYTELWVTGTTANVVNGVQADSTFELHVNKTASGTVYEYHRKSSELEYWVSSDGFLAYKSTGQPIHCANPEATTLATLMKGSLGLEDSAASDVAVTAGGEGDHLSVTTFEEVVFNTNAAVVFPDSLTCLKGMFASRAHDSQALHTRRLQEEEDIKAGRKERKLQTMDCTMAHMADDAYNNAESNIDGWTRHDSVSQGNMFAKLYKKNNQYALAYRGSDDVTDFMSDVAGATGGVRSYGGKSHHWAITDQVIDFDTAVNAMMDKNGVGRSNVNYLTGHSLGGAMATIRKADSSGSFNPTLTTFGALATGQGGSGTCDTSGTRYANENDPAVGNLNLLGVNTLSAYHHDPTSAKKVKSSISCLGFEETWWCRRCNWRGCDCGWEQSTTCETFGSFTQEGLGGSIGCTDKQHSVAIVTRAGWDNHAMTNYINAVCR